MLEILIIGGGFAGCAAAEILSTLENTNIDLIEKSNFLGAGNKTRWYGGHPYTFGPRHFLSPYEEAFRYLNEIVPIRLCPEHEFLSYVPGDNRFYAYPINMQDVKTMPDYPKISQELQQCKANLQEKTIEPKNLEEYWINSVGETLYNKIIKNYNKKMWLIDDNKQLDTFNWSPKGVAIKEGPKAAWDNVYSGYPYAPDGYDKYFDYATRNVNVYLNQNVKTLDLEKKILKLDGQTKQYDYIINTGPIDSLLNGCYGDLPYLGRSLDLIVFPVEYSFPKNVYFLYYTGSERFTRLVEYKKFTHHKDPNTLIGMETPVNNGGKDYPMPFKWAQKLAQKYFNSVPCNVFSVGRAGTYLYGVDIDDCIMQALRLKELIKSGSWEYPVPGKEWMFPEL